MLFFSVMFASQIMQLLLGSLSLSTTLVLCGSLTASADLKIDQYLEQSALIELVTTMQSEIGLIKSELKETITELEKTKSALTESRNVLAQTLIKVYQSIYNADAGFL